MSDRQPHAANALGMGYAERSTPEGREDRRRQIKAQIAFYESRGMTEQAEELRQELDE